MGLDNVAVLWPRVGDCYEPVAPAEFVDFLRLAGLMPSYAAPAAALASHIAQTGTVRVNGYAGLVDLLLGLTGVLRATEAAAEDEDPVIDPDGCAWIAGGLERFIEGHLALEAEYPTRIGQVVTFETVSAVLRRALEGSRLADQQLAWLQHRLDGLRDETGAAPQWDYSLPEIGILAKFYRRCADRGFAVFADR